MAAVSPRPVARSDDRRTIEDDEAERLLDAFNDAGCRAILQEAGGEARSAKELSERCDLPLSTTYRKLELLVEANLLEEGIRIRRSGKHTSEYVRCVDDVHLSVRTDGGIQLTLDGRADEER